MVSSLCLVCGSYNCQTSVLGPVRDTASFVDEVVKRPANQAKKLPWENSRMTKPVSFSVQSRWSDCHGPTHMTISFRSMKILYFVPNVLISQPCALFVLEKKRKREEKQSK